MASSGARHQWKAADIAHVHGATVANRSGRGKNSLNREVLLGESAHRSAGWQSGFGLVDDSANADLKQSLAPSPLGEFRPRNKKLTSDSFT